MDLYVDENTLSELPEEIGNYTALKWLELRYNRLSNLPYSIDNLCNLECLTIDANTQLTVFHKSYSKLTSLTRLDLDTELPGNI